MKTTTIPSPSTPSPSPVKWTTSNPIQVPTTTTTTTLESFYRRPLPDSCVAFSSRQGRQRLTNSLQTGGVKSFFALMEQHTTQSEPAYCGLSTLVMALNALAVDPLQNWKGPWRWYEEQMVNCCVDLNTVRAKGLTLAVFAGIAACQGLSVDLNYADEGDENTALERFRRAVELACVEKDHDLKDAQPNDPSHAAATTTSDDDDDDSTAAVSLDTVLAVSYSRKVLGQTGAGHFSPIVAYDPITDSVLIADTARFKYGAHWVHLPLLFSAMKPKDPDTDRSRGYVLLRLPVDAPNREHQMSILLRALHLKRPAHHTLQHLVDTNTSGGGGGGGANQHVSFLEFHRMFAHTDGTFLPLIWQLVRPQVKPISQNVSRMTQVDRFTSILDSLLQSELQDSPSSAALSGISSSCTSSACRSSTWPSSVQCQSTKCRTVPIGPDQATYMVYLASLGEKSRFDQAVDRANIAFDDTAQLFWNEVLLLRKDLDLD